MLSATQVPSSHEVNSTSWWTKLRDIPVYGDKLTGKSENMVRLYFENIDGFGLHRTSAGLAAKKDIVYFIQLMQRLGVDIIGGAEVRTQWKLVPQQHSLSKLLDLRDGSRCIAAFNTHERFTINQQGGTFMAAMPQICENFLESGSDAEGLGRWCWMKLAGQQITTRVITAYAPCKTRKEARTATMAQQKRYWRMKGEHRCPRKLFREQLVGLLREWRTQGEKLILMLDGNEDMRSGSLAKLLRNEELDMIDTVATRTGGTGPPTFIRGSRQIDAVWATRDVELSTACFLPFHFGLGDHRGILVDIPVSTIIGAGKRIISRPSGRRLQCNKKVTVEKYVSSLETYCFQHRIASKLQQISAIEHSSKVILQRQLDVIDRVLGEGMRMAENKCRHIRAGEVPFSAELADAGLQIKLWGLVIRSKRGHNINSRYIRRVAQRCGLQRVLAVSINDAYKNKHKAWQCYRKAKRSAARLRAEFLRTKIEQAQSAQERKEIQNILLTVYDLTVP